MRTLNFNNNGLLVKAGKIDLLLKAKLYSIGEFINKDPITGNDILSTPAPGQTYKSIAFDSACVINDGIIDLSNNVPLLMSGSIINNKEISFFYEGIIEYSASVLNNGNFYNSSVVWKGPVINNKDMTIETFLTAVVESALYHLRKTNHIPPGCFEGNIYQQRRTDHPLKKTTLKKSVDGFKE